ncbi:hypothetical protein HL658_13175 [Azospirillum sp. RWY-5-1]|uniref:Uncharacterized protein n=1 Tax=Azospirillum oleiclasticum TaxID=2735135 RepID=A0ABX2T9B9_9PROT|nr:hypothetical protein [Azospirillum oleiclasticum]NYZ13506.1 hypothetical protein [Azospirillum oleiclasticum]NYZ20667.1 hypothetical protein [Azospirillum oleiclasticum]
MRSTSPSTLVSRMIAMAAGPEQTPEKDERGAARVKRIVWASQAAVLRSTLPCHLVHQIEAAVAADLDAMELPEIFFTSVEAMGRVVTCDLDAGGTASIFGLIDPTEYDDLVEEAGDDALFGVDWDGVYVTPARTRH